MASFIKKLASQTAIYGLSSIVGRLLNYLLVPLYTRLFLPNQYGIVTELYAYTVFLLVLLTYGTETAFFRFAKDKLQNKVFSTILIALFTSSTVFIAVVFLFINPIADFLQYAQHQHYIKWFAVIVAVDAFVSIPFANLRLHDKAVKFVTFKLLNIGLNIGLNLFFLLYCPSAFKANPNAWFSFFYNPNFGIEYIFISNLIASLFTLLIFLPDLLRVKWQFNAALLRQILRYSAPLMLAGLAGMVNESLDRILLKHFLLVPEHVLNAGEYVMAQIGIYGANYKLAILMTLFIQTFRYAVEPFFFKQAQYADAKQKYALVMNYFVVFGLLIFLGITLFIDIVKFFIDVTYHQGLQIVPILLVANLFLGVIFNLSVWYKLTNRTLYGAALALFGAAVTIAFNLMLIPKMGYIGSAWATLICYSGMMVVSYFLGQRFYKINYAVLKLSAYFAFALFLFFADNLLHFSSKWLAYLLKSFFLISFVAIAYFFEIVFPKRQTENV